MIENNLGMKGFISTYSLFHITVHHQGMSKQQLIQNHEGVPLTGLLLLAFSVSFLIQPRITCPGLVLTTVIRVFPHRSLMKKMPHTNWVGLLTDQSDVDMFSIVIPSYQVTLVCIKLSTKQNRTGILLDPQEATLDGNTWHYVISKAD